MSKCQTGFNVSFLLCTDLRAELQLDWLKGARGGVRRVLFLDTQEPQRTMLLRLGHRHPRACLTHTIYLKVSTRMQPNEPTEHNASHIYHRHEKQMRCFLFCYTVRRMMSSGTNWPLSRWHWTTAWLHLLAARTSHPSSTITAAPSSRNK